ncbi:uncharacterized protein LOC144167518 [Haemaphysalis longicornis]
MAVSSLIAFCYRKEETKMKLFVFLFALLLAVKATGASPLEKRALDKSDDAAEQYWKQPLGWVLEQLGRWLQHQAAAEAAAAGGYYSPSDGALYPQLIPRTTH